MLTAASQPCSDFIRIAWGSIMNLKTCFQLSIQERSRFQRLTSIPWRMTDGWSVYVGVAVKPWSLKSQIFLPVIHIYWWATRNAATTLFLAANMYYTWKKKTYWKPWTIFFPEVHSADQREPHSKKYHTNLNNAECLNRVESSISTQ